MEQRKNVEQKSGRNKEQTTAKKKKKRWFITKNHLIRKSYLFNIVSFYLLLLNL